MHAVAQVSEIYPQYHTPLNCMCETPCNLYERSADHQLRCFELRAARAQTNAFEAMRRILT